MGKGYNFPNVQFKQLENVLWEIEEKAYSKIINKCYKVRYLMLQGKVPKIKNGTKYELG